jgi:Anti-sigma factor NepR
MNTGMGNLHPVVDKAGRGFGKEAMTERKPLGHQKPMDLTAAKTKKAGDKPAKLGREVQARLGQQLRAMYDDVVNQGVPDRFTELLDRLDRNGNKDKS